ncbi:MAG: AtpZ/AtpI family protein [Nitrospiraceae bacterium]|nr:AtpZ/AtpI family protein [Nitrospiraceae bacterium]
MPGNNNEKEKSPFRLLLDASELGINFIVSILVGLAIGYFLDKAFHTSFPWFKIFFLLMGIAAGFKEIIKKTVQKDTEKPGDASKPDEKK